MGRRPRLWLGSLCTCTTALVYNHSTSHKVELLVLCILSPFEGGNEGDETAAWYEEDASWASAGTAPPVDFTRDTTIKISMATSMKKLSAEDKATPYILLPKMQANI
uniref:Uncharacterized protein n=1 Tax=Rhizophora mucronata TaxID=61149 RepID=A0A2P2KGL0_RHIMU